MAGAIHKVFVFALRRTRTAETTRSQAHGSRTSLVGSPVFFTLPSATALYDKQGKLPHAAHCSTRFCAIPAAIYLANEAGVAFPSSKLKVSDRHRRTHPHPPLPTRSSRARRAGFRGFV